jgi:hypothetical protein
MITCCGIHVVHYILWDTCCEIVSCGRSGEENCATGSELPPTDSYFPYHNPIILGEICEIGDPLEVLFLKLLHQGLPKHKLIINCRKTERLGFFLMQTSSRLRALCWSYGIIPSVL